MRPPLWNTGRMTEQPDDSPRRVVKKVVKKTVVRPSAPSSVLSAGSTASASTATPSAPHARPARLTTPRRPQATRSVAPTPAAAAAPPRPNIVRAAPASQPTTPSSTPSPAAERRRRPGLPALSLPRPDVRGRAVDLGHGIGDGVRDALTGIRHRIEDGWDWFASLRLPHLSPVRGSAITGVVVGLLAVLIGWGFYEIFSATLGTQAGGGWGFIAFVFLSFVTFILGELMLAGFGVPHAGVVSILAVLLDLLAVLVFFIELAAGVWAWLLIPVLTALSFVASSALIGVAAREDNPQRLPWEPTDESQVKTD